MLKKAGHAKSDCKQTFMKQLTLCRFENPLLSLEKCVIENCTVSVKFNLMFCTGLYGLAFSFYSLGYCITILGVSNIESKSRLPQDFASFVGSKSRTIAFFSSFYSSIAASLGSSCFTSTFAYSASVLVGSTTGSVLVSVFSFYGF